MQMHTSVGPSYNDGLSSTLHDNGVRSQRTVVQLSVSAVTGTADQRFNGNNMVLSCSEIFYKKIVHYLSVHKETGTVSRKKLKKYEKYFQTHR
jgi:hypothetical protein